MLPEVSSARGRKSKKLTRPGIFEMKILEGEKNMKPHITLTRIMTLALLVATLTINTASVAGAAVNAASPAAGQAEVTTPATNIDFGGIKLGRGQYAVIIVVCVADQSGDQRPVDVEFMFHDWNGNLLAGKTETLMPGHASSFDISEAIRLPGRGSELMPCVKVLCDPTDPRAKRVVATLQISDESGKVQSTTMRKAGGLEVE